MIIRWRHILLLQRAGALVLLILLGSLAVGYAKPEEERHEVQHHGYVFEKWVRDTFFGGYVATDYTQKWDIPKEVNKNHGGVPVNPKAIKYGTAVDMGDALRQFQIDEPFMLIIGFWTQEGEQKRIVNIAAPLVTPQVYRKLWEPITLEDLKKLDAVVKDRGLDYKQARAAAQKIKSQAPFSKAIITLNPKIDSKTQRRLQCSLRFSYVFKYLAPDADPKPQDAPKLFGVPYPGLIASPARNAEPAPVTPKQH